MKLGYIGLGKMGSNMVERLLEKGYDVIAFDRNVDAAQAVKKIGGGATDTLGSLIAALMPSRLVWIMVPYQAVDSVLQEIAPLLGTGDVVIDGGNSPYEESVRRAQELEARGIDFLDAGVSGGPIGARSGACIMVGGRKEVYQRCEALFRDLAVPAVMKAADFRLDLAKIADVYNHRSVIESRLVGWLQSAFLQYGEDFTGISGSVAQSGEGLWTVEAGKKLGVPTPIIEAALDFRIRSQEHPSYTGKVLSAMRNLFGGHDVKAIK
jgi:6-phosphogluconate dehydrogenase